MKRKANTGGSEKSNGPGKKPAKDAARDGLRVDRWLWSVRFFKTRALASRAVAGGHIRRNGERAKPGDRVRPGDRLEIVRAQERFQVEATALPQRRGPAGEASRCYVESEESIQQRQQQKELLKNDRLAMPRTEGRPDKHTRRLLRERQRSGE
ncbi:MAG: S4 domain-containing protein [Woeseia sp.]